MRTGTPEALTLEQELSRLLPRNETPVLDSAPVQAHAADEAHDNDRSTSGGQEGSDGGGDADRFQRTRKSQQRRQT